MKQHLFRYLVLSLLLTAFSKQSFAQFNFGAVALTELKLINRAWHLTNKRGSDYLLRAAGNGLRADNNVINLASTFVIEPGTNDASWTTSDKRWFYIKNKENGQYLTVANDGAFPRSVSFGEYDPDNFGQQFRLIIQGQADQYKLRCRLSQDGPDLVLEVNANGDLQADSPHVDPSSEQKFSFNLAMPVSGSVIIPINTKRGRYLSDNGILMDNTVVVQNNKSDEACGWVFEHTNGDYYRLRNKLTGQYLTASTAADVVCRTTGTNDRSEWKLDRNNATFILINKHYNAPLSVGIFYSLPGSAILMGNIVDLEQIAWILTEAPADYAPDPGSFDRIETGVLGANCLSIIGPQFKKAVCERACLNASDARVEQNFAFVQEAIADKFGSEEVINILDKLDLNNDGHRVDLALIVRRYVTETLPSIPRNQWSPEAEAAVSELESRIEGIRQNYANRLNDDWNAYVDQQGGNLNFTDLYFFWLDGNGFVWPDYNPEATEYFDQVMQYGSAAAGFQERNGQLGASTGIGMTAILTEIFFATGVARSTVASGVIASIVGTIDFPAKAFLVSAGPVVGVATTACSFLTIQIQDNLDLNEFVDGIQSQLVWANQSVDIHELMNGNNMIEASKMLTDLDFIFATPEIVHNFDDNQYEVPFAISCYPNVTINLDENGEATLSALEVLTPLLQPVCGGDQIVSFSNMQFDCNNIGSPTTVTATVSNSRLTLSCQSNVTVADKLPPVITCKTAEIYLDATGTAHVTAVQLFENIQDNCSAVTVGSYPTSFTCSQIGQNNIPISVSDAYGNSNSCTATVTVFDITPPGMSCQAATIDLDASGLGVLTPSMINNASSDNCTLAQLGLSQASFSCADLGTNVISLTGTDQSSNTASCEATVTVRDILAPNVNCKVKHEVLLDANGIASIVPADVLSSAADNCSTVTLESVTPSSFSCANQNGQIVTLTVSDNSGNTATCTSIVSVRDVNAPQMLCKNLSVSLNASGQVNITPAQVNNGSTDNCGINSLNLSRSTFSCADLGPNTVVLTGTDQAGNSSSCTAVVSVSDLMAPVAKCKNATVNLDANGTVTVPAMSVNNGSTDNCSYTATLTPNVFTCGQIGLQTVVFKITDQGGNTASCNAKVTVLDNTGPTAKCKNPIVFLDGTGNASLTVSQIDDGSTDNCGIATKSINVTSLNCSDLGAPRSVTLSLTDVNGNTSSCLANVTVKDAAVPTAVCENVTVHLGSNGYATVYSSNLADNSFDNCSVWSYSPTAKVYNSSNIGQNNLTITVKDWSLNAATCVSVVTVLPQNNWQDHNAGYKDGVSGVQEIDDQIAVVLKPNPTTSWTTLAINLQEDQVLGLRVLDANGRIVIAQTLEGLSGENEFALDLGLQPPGLYLVDLMVGTQRTQRRLVKIQE